MFGLLLFYSYYQLCCDEWPCVCIILYLCRYSFRIDSWRWSCYVKSNTPGIIFSVKNVHLLKEQSDWVTILFKTLNVYLLLKNFRIWLQYILLVLFHMLYHFLLQGIFPTQRSTPCLLYCRQPLTVWITINCGKFWKR